MQKLIKICKCDRCGDDIPTERIHVELYDLKRIGRGIRAYDLCDTCWHKVTHKVAETINDMIESDFTEPEGRPMT